MHNIHNRQGGEMKPIFENEEEARAFIDNTLPGYADILYCGLKREDYMLGEIKLRGYIKKSVVEAAEEMYKQGFNKVDLVELQHKAIQQLKAEIEMLK